MEATETKPDPTKPAAPQVIQRTLVRKIAEIMGEISRVAKSGHNAFHNYDYATEADIAESVRLGMAKRGLALLPNVEKSEFAQLGKMRLCTLTVAFTLEDGDSGETRVIHIVGEGTDQGDKASYKAMTGAEKYALMKLFLIPTGDDPERDDPRPPPLSAQTPRPPAPPARKMPPIVDECGPSPWKRIEAALRKAELFGKPAVDLIAAATGKSNRKLLVDADVAKVEAAIAARPPKAPAKPAAPPPPVSAEEAEEILAYERSLDAQQQGQPPEPDVPY